MSLEALLDTLNKEYITRHERYEDLFWRLYTGDPSVGDEMNEAKNTLERWKSDATLSQQITDAVANTTDEELRTRGNHRKLFFSLYQTPDLVKDLKEKIQKIETDMNTKLNAYQRYYIDPDTQEKVNTSKHGLMLTMQSNPDERVRKACFEGLEEGAPLLVEDYIGLVALRNEFARALGHKNFYYYKANIEERMSADTIFQTFASFYEKTKASFDTVREIEKTKPGLREPWNMGYMLGGDFVKQEDPYFPLQNMIESRGRSFHNLGLTFNGGTLQLDLLFRQGKRDNGFCHYPTPLAKINGERTKYRCNLTCNALIGKIGSGVTTGTTLFHEGGHAADRAHSTQYDVCINTEYPPSSTAWAETHSMFCDTMYSSIEWKTRYAQALDGSYYPWSLHENRIRALKPVNTKRIFSIASVVDFERQIYEAETLTPQGIIDLAKETSLKFFDYATPSLWSLTVFHLYDSSAACAYHGYGLATFAYTQRRNYFYEKYGYIVDNPDVGEELKKARETGSAYSFEESLKMATGSTLQPDAYIEELMLPTETLLAKQLERVKKMESIPKTTDPINLDAHIRLVNGDELIATNEISFADMCEGWKNKIQTGLSTHQPAN